MADQEKTILKFRDLVKQLQAENDSLNRKLQSKLEEERNVSRISLSTTQYDFKQKFFEIKNFAKVGGVRGTLSLSSASYRHLAVTLNRKWRMSSTR